MRYSGGPRPINKSQSSGVLGTHGGRCTRMNAARSSHVATNMRTGIVRDITVMGFSTPNAKVHRRLHSDREAAGNP
jgi:hypothetical protein